ncbi:unnamed protein product [Leptidea sinapis]|nr:unnamed protein product [Leptidea sinapis]
MDTNTSLVVSSPNIKYTDEYIYSDYKYQESLVTRTESQLVVKPYHSSLQIRTSRKVGKIGVMLVGWGGNNGSTFTAAVLANRHQLSWNTKNGRQDPNWFGSITQASTVKLGINEKGEDVFVGMSQLLPMVDPDDLVHGTGQGRPRHEPDHRHPLPAVIAGVHDTSDNIEKALRANHSEISPSTIFALAAIDEGCCYINGSPQNTIVSGVIERAEQRGVFVAGLKPVSIVSYNHLGNNDGKNLSAPKQFRSKEPDHVVVIKYVPYVGE